MSKKFISGVYFILNEDTKLIKVGCSKDINKRYRDLQSQNEHLGYTNKLVLLDKILVDNYYDLEQYIHNKFSEKRVINEWFDITEKDINEIKSELDDNSYRGFDSGYIKMDRNVTNEFLNMGLSYNDIGIVFHLKDFINTENVLETDGKPINQKGIIEILKMKKTRVYEILKFLNNKNIMVSIKSPRNSKSNIYILNPKYFRLSNYNNDNKYKDIFKEKDKELAI